MKKSFCKQNCVRRKTLTQDLEALTSNSGSTYMTLGTSLNQSINQSLSLSLSLSPSVVKWKRWTRLVVFKLSSMESTWRSCADELWAYHSCLDWSPFLFSLMSYYGLLCTISSKENILVAVIIKPLNYIIWKPPCRSAAVFIQVHKCGQSITACLS